MSFAKTIGKQGRMVGLAGALAAGGLWIGTALGGIEVGVFVALGVVLGLVNGMFTELTVQRAVASEELPTKKQYAMTSLVRLAFISLIAFAIAVLFWPKGATVLVGLALFHLITVVLTGIPLLKELRKA